MPLAVPEVALPLAGVGVAIGEHGDAPPRPQPAHPAARVVVGGAGEGPPS